MPKFWFWNRIKNSNQGWKCLLRWDNRSSAIMWMLKCWLGTRISCRKVLLDASVVACCFFLEQSCWGRSKGRDCGWTFLFLEVVLAWSFLHSRHNTEEATTVRNHQHQEWTCAWSNSHSVATGSSHSETSASFQWVGYCGCRI